MPGGWYLEGVPVPGGGGGTCAGGRVPCLTCHTHTQQKKKKKKKILGQVR